ncbi:hypothetical protein [Methylopila sp. 73B]|uniref:glycosyltransferase n=1 Tax=Methylopila sp. 73B TaxID=1120792 RepID=UPI00037E8866|nr:hypothetical protein [Methylopila sp. 73B]
MRRALLAWEGGAGRGHVVTLKTVAEALGDRFVFDAALCRMEHAAELEPVCELVFPGGALRPRDAHRRGPGAVHTATWGEFLGDLGFRDEAFLTRQIAWWQEVIRCRRIALVVGDFAPCALMAARSLGVPAVAIGVGYSCPPPDMPAFPIFMPEHAERLYDERDIVAAVNRAATPLGVPEIDRLPAVYASDDQLARTLPMLDPYDGLRTRPLLPPVADLPTAPSDGSGEEIFVYFSTTERDDPALMEALEDLGAPTRAFIPGLDAAVAGRLAARGVTVEAAPVPVDAIARRTRLLLSAGQHGILCLGLGAGLPQVAAPQHLEQGYHARRAAEAGVMKVVSRDERSAEAFRAAVRSAYAQPVAAARARALAADLRPRLACDPRVDIRARVLAVTG